MVHGRRVRQARELRGLTQSELARRAGVKQPAIAQIEGGAVQPARQTIEAIALQTRFPVSFFESAPIDYLPEGSLRFRARASMTARQESEVYWWGALGYELLTRMSARLHRPALRLPVVSTEDTEHAAELTRSALGIAPDVPIRHLVRTVERAGVVVLALPLELPRRDAYSLWAGEDGSTPVIIVCNSEVGDRLRHSIAHELGHLVMHRTITRSVDTIEREANRFAGALLLPSTGFRPDLPERVTIAGLAPLKPKWGVSIQAMIVRCHSLQLIGDRQYSYLFEQLSAKGWRKREPANLDVPIERPRALRKMAEMLYGNPIDHRRFAKDLRLVRPDTALELLDVHEGPPAQATPPVKRIQSSRLLQFADRSRKP